MIVTDFRGVEITPGCRAVVAIPSRRLREVTVKAVEDRSHGWVSVRFEDGGWTTPDRLAVLA